jgi:hypothetical protein
MPCQQKGARLETVVRYLEVLAVIGSYLCWHSGGGSDPRLRKLSRTPRLEVRQTQAVIGKQRALHGLGRITRAHCIRAERYVERHPEVFSDESSMTVSQAAAAAIGYTAFAL